MGGCNLHLPATFSDGVEWIVRIPQQHVRLPPLALHRAIVTSEIATLKYLKAIDLPIPKVFDIQLSESNPAGVSFVVCEFVRGEPCMWKQPTAAQRTHFISQYARVLVRLSEHPFSSIGVLQSEGGEIGPVLDPEFVDCYDDTYTRIGPFPSSREYYHHLLRTILAEVRDGRRYISCPVDGYLVHLQLLEVIDLLYPTESQASDGQFFIKHPDDKGDNFLVDEDFNITALIDWERTKTCPPEEAFAGPTFTLDVGDFYDGVNTLSADETTLAKALQALERPDLATYVVNGKKYQRFQFCVGGRIENMEEFWPLFRSLMEAVGLREWVSWDAWKSHALQKSVYGSDLVIQELLKRTLM
ncbi:hypothetical protein EXIGLDRAFT_266179 [Exidia glandulosa HHB12029]|uniref:Aminoglycoside phosphotransferase domain-containing protein n=1 Tax=Exidia glandulosa HHB12029 TaxID=1314781 RepID=A0A166B8V3_EXIGL|nr:hypothetical protein EXIGLDRAFT_266179 [Exidia glandulosa HHB12029]